MKIVFAVTSVTNSLLVRKDCQLTKETIMLKLSNYSAFTAMSIIDLAIFYF
jgi:hypothetical protein